jgi:hypothetical protein
VDNPRTSDLGGVVDFALLIENTKSGDIALSPSLCAEACQRDFSV